MQFFALDDDESILAQEALRHKNYLCPECLHPVRVRGGPHVREHFYHLRSNRKCTQHKKSLIHLAVQNYLLEILPQGEVVLENPFSSIGRIADVHWKTKNIVFEVQYSSISLKEAEERCRDYQKLGIKLIWILHSKQFNKKKLNAAESFLRSHTNCYFTNMNALGKGIFYDQFEINRRGIRLFKGTSLSLDLRNPQEPKAVFKEKEAPLQVKERIDKWPLYFPGDLTSHFLRGQNFTSLLSIERRFSLVEKKNAFSLIAMLQNIYKTLFNILLEKASH